MADHNDDGFDEAYANSWFELSKSDYARVIFCSVSSYDEKVGVCCRFQITDNVHEDPCDYVGLYRVGWKNISQFIVLKLLSQIECEENGKILRCMFKGEEMPKLNDGFYQFLYVTRDNKVCGASIPFEVDRSPKDESSDEDIVADKTEDDFLVVRSNVFDKNRCMEKTLCELYGKIDSLVLEKKKLNSIIEKTAEENEALVELKEKIIEKVDLEKKELLADIEKLTEENKVIKSREKNIEKLVSEKKELLAAMEKIAEENKNLLQLKEQSIENLESEKKELLAEVEKIAEENKILLKLKESNAATLQTYSDQVTFLQSSLQTNSAEFENFRKTSQSIRNENEVKLYELEKKWRRAEDTVKLLRHRGNIMGTSRPDVAYLQQMLNDSQSMLCAAEESKQLAIEELKKLQAKNSNPKPDHNLVVEKFALELKLKDEREISEQSMMHCEELENELSNCRKMMNGQKAMLEESHTREAILQEKIDQLSSAGQNDVDEELMKAIMDDSETISKLTQDVLQKNEIIDRMKDQINDLNMKCAVWEEEIFDFKSYCGELKQTVANEEASSLKLKEECIKKEAVIEFLSKEKDELLKKQASLNEALNDMGARLKMAADLYREQYLKISALNKIIKSKSKVHHINSMDCSIEEQASSSRISDRPSCSASSTTSQNSDSDTGEHFQRATEKVVKMMNEVHVQSSEDARVVDSLSHLAQLSAPDQSGKLQHECARDPSGSFRKREGAKEEALHQMIEQNLANLSASSPVPKCVEEEVVTKEYALPCSMCECMIEVFSNNTDAMIEHLEKVHQQQMCPICGCLFDMNMPEKYFQFHIDDHYNETEGKLA